MVHSVYTKNPKLTRDRAVLEKNFFRLDFAAKIDYNITVLYGISRCVGMADEGDSKSLVLITRVGSTPTTGIRSSLESNDSGLLFFFQKTLHRNRLGTLYCHEGDWSWIYFFNGQCADAAGTALWQWLGQQRR